MPDLSHHSTLAWLRARDPGAAALARPGPADADAAALKAVLRLGTLLDRAAEADAVALAEALCRPETAAAMRRVLPQLGVARRLRLLEWFAGSGGLPHGRVLVAALGDGPDGAFQRAELAALERRAVLERLFAPERVAEVRAAMGAGETRR